MTFRTVAQPFARTEPMTIYKLTIRRNVTDPEGNVRKSDVVEYYTSLDACSRIISNACVLIGDPAYQMEVHSITIVPIRLMD